MPSFNIIKQSDHSESYRTKVLRGTYDISEKIIVEKFQGEIPIENMNWHIGIIYGRSGSGKSTIAKELFQNQIVKEKEFNEKSLIDEFDPRLKVEEIAKILNGVGLSTIPSWLKPYNVLSEGEKMRVRLAMAILENDFIVFDEYTSVINREVAKMASYVTSKIIRKNNKKFIAVSCHDDIIDWLEPDWVFCTDTMKFEITKKKDQKFQSRYMKKRATGRYLKSIII